MRPKGGAIANERWFRQFQGFQGKARIREKRPKRALEELGGPPRSLEALLGLFSLILAFPWARFKNIRFLAAFGKEYSRS